jgi:hypothetical protein
VAAAAAIGGVDKPDWYRSVFWRDPVHRVWWRADETGLVEQSAVTAGATIATDPGSPLAVRASLLRHGDRVAGDRHLNS